MNVTYGVAVEATVTVHSDCDMSCEMIADQVQLIFGTVDTGLHLYLDRPALDRLMTVVRAARMHAETMPQDLPTGFTVSADANSREAHRPNYPHDYSGELLVSDVDNETGRHYII